MNLKFEDISVSNRNPTLLKSEPFPYFCWDFQQTYEGII